MESFSSVRLVGVACVLALKIYRRGNDRSFEACDAVGYAVQWGRLVFGSRIYAQALPKIAALILVASARGRVAQS